MNSTILLVDDDDAISPLVKHAIRRTLLQIELHAVPDGELAVDYLVRNGKYADAVTYPFPSLILLDLKIPRMNGFEFLEWERTQPQLDLLPVAIWSSSNLPKDKERALQLGAIAYFLKPMETAGFAELLGRLPTLYHTTPVAAA